MKTKATICQVNAWLEPLGIKISRVQMLFVLWQLQTADKQQYEVCLDDTTGWLTIDLFMQQLVQASNFNIMELMKYSRCIKQTIPNPYKGAKSLEEMEIRKDLLGTRFAV